MKDFDLDRKIMCPSTSHMGWGWEESCKKFLLGIATPMQDLFQTGFHASSWGWTQALEVVHNLHASDLSEGMHTTPIQALFQRGFMQLLKVASYPMQAPFQRWCATHTQAHCQKELSATPMQPP